VQSEAPEVKFYELKFESFKLELKLVKEKIFDAKTAKAYKYNLPIS